MEIRCPKCALENPSDNKFCWRCGQRLTAKCRKCGTENSLEFERCSLCGAENWSSPKGMNSERASEWRGLFKAINWIEYYPDKVKEANSKLMEMEWIVPIDEKNEIIIISVMIGDRDWFPIKVSTPQWQSNKGYLWFTDKRVVCSTMVENEFKAYQIWYQDLRDARWESDMMWLLGRDDQKLEIYVKVKGPGFLDLTVAAFGTDPFIKATAAIQTKRKANDVQEFGQAMSLFLNDLEFIAMKGTQ